jgi:hypothetical protein
MYQSVFCYYNEISELIKLQREKVCFVSVLEVLSMISQNHYSGPVMRVLQGKGGSACRVSAHIIVRSKRERGRGQGSKFLSRAPKSSH